MSFVGAYGIGPDLIFPRREMKIEAIAHHRDYTVKTWQLGEFSTPEYVNPELPHPKDRKNLRVLNNMSCIF